MKTLKLSLFKINIALIVINSFLLMLPLAAMAFLVVLGALQVLFALVIWVLYKQLDKEGLNELILYSIITAGVLITMYGSNMSMNDGNFTICMLISVGLAFLNLHITYLFSKPIES